MTRIVVAAKQNQILLQDSQSKNLILDQPSIIQIGVTKQDVKTIEKSGNNLVITLNNGEKIVLENFFQANATSAHSLAFPERDGTFALANFNEAGKFTNYTGMQKLDSLVYESANPTSTQTLSAYDSTSEDSDFSFSNLMSSSTLKAGLGILSAVGLGLALVDGNKGSSTSKDVTAPGTPTAALSADAKQISGTAEAGSTVYVVDKTEKVISSAKADKDGKYTIDLPEALENNTTYYLNAKDKAGNASGYTSVTGTKDTIAPDEPQAQLNDQGNIVTGKAEANSTVHVYGADGNLIGTAKANANGTFSVAISPSISAGQIGTVEVVDDAGNKSPKHNIELGKDTIAPDHPLFQVSKDGLTVTGIAEANAKVIIQDAAGKEIGRGTVDANGHFNLTNSTALDSAKSGKIIIEDAAGNQSKAVDIKAGQDTIAPDAPVASLDADGKIVTGTAEADALVSVYDSKNNLLGTATADASGKYSVTLSTALTETLKGTVYATDKALNKSEATIVTGTKDVTAPSSPKITDAVDDVGLSKGTITANGTTDDKQPVISGTGEANATVIISDNNQAVGHVVVGADGKWSYSFTSDLSLGSHSITAVQTDKAGNTSLASDARTFTVEEPVASVVEPTSMRLASVEPSSAVDLTDTHNTVSDLSSVLENTTGSTTSSSVVNDSLVNPLESVLNEHNAAQTQASQIDTSATEESNPVSVQDLLTSTPIDNSVNPIENVLASVTDASTSSNDATPYTTTADTSSATDLVPTLSPDVYADLLDQHTSII